MHRKLAIIAVLAVLGVIGAGAALAGQPSEPGCFGQEQGRVHPDQRLARRDRPRRL